MSTDLVTIRPLVRGRPRKDGKPRSEVLARIHPTDAAVRVYIAAGASEANAVAEFLSLCPQARRCAVKNAGDYPA